MMRAIKLIRAAEITNDEQRKIPFDVAVLDTGRTPSPPQGDHAGLMATCVLVDFPEAVVLEDRDVLVLDDGRHAEDLLLPTRNCSRFAVAIRCMLPSLAWHIGNRHLAAAIEAERILILRDHVIRSMLDGLGAAVSEVVEPFNPLGGAYSRRQPWSFAQS